jgi:hypothetical protein
MKKPWTLFVSVILASSPSTAFRTNGDGVGLRGLQSDNDLVISEPEATYSEMQLVFDYEVRDDVRQRHVEVELFRDGACTKKINPEFNDYIQTKIQNGSPVGDGSGTRTVGFWSVLCLCSKRSFTQLLIHDFFMTLQMNVMFNIDPETITNSQVISFTDAQAIVSFCVRFTLFDPAAPALTVDSLNTPIVIAVDLNDSISITGIIEDDEEKYGAEAFECDLEDNPIVDSQTNTNQGDTIRVCVRPDAVAREFGVVIKSINSFLLQRGDVEQDVITPNEVVESKETTEYRCTSGQPLCSFTTVVNNDFYYSKGEVGGIGEAWLQYQYGGSIRRLVKVPIRRKTREAGGFIGARPVELTFEVVPSEPIYKAIAFECDDRNVALNETRKEEPKVVNDTIRVCVTPDKDATDRGVFIRYIASFFFEQGENTTQLAVEPTGKEAADNATLLFCNPGDLICVFETTLSENFFKSGEPAVGIGEIVLQFGSDNSHVPSTRRAKVVTQRETQTTGDGGFAGLSEVRLSFNVENMKEPSERTVKKTWKETASDWWHSTPVYLRFIYIIAFFTLELGIVFCSLVLFCGWPIGRKVRIQGFLHQDPRASKNDDEDDTPVSSVQAEIGVSSSHSKSRATYTSSVDIWARE